MSSSTPDTTPKDDMGELLDSFEPMKPLRRGDVVEGMVMRADPDGIFVNIGHKAEGVVPPGEMRSLKRDDLQELKVGDEIMTLVVRAETAEHAAILSIDRAVGEQGWRILEKAMEAGDSVTGVILGFNRGGAIVESEGVQGFVPMSQLISVSRAQIRETQEPRPVTEETPRDSVVTQQPAQAEATDTASAEEAEAAETASLEEPEGEETAPAEDAEGEETATAEEPTATETTTAEEPIAAETAPAEEPEAPEPPPESPDIGRELELKVLEVNRGRNRAIFSERQAVQHKREEQKARLIEELTEGEVRRGKVTGISSFGAFVDLGGADGLIHISELSWNQVGSPEEVVQVGQEVDVFVLRVDAENKKIALSLRRLQPEPWDSIREQYNVGDVVPATVTKLTNFGAFARVEGSEGSVEGLIHISELSSRMISHPREVVREGDAVKLKILRIEPERRRLGLSLMQAQEEGEF